MPAVAGLPDFLQHLARSCADQSFVRLTLSAPPAGATVERILARLIRLGEVDHLSLTLREARRDTTRNLPLGSALDWLAQQLEHGFRSALLATTAADWQLHRTAHGHWQLVRHRPRHTEAPARNHDQSGTTFLGPAAQPWLAGLGLVDAQGRPRPGLAHKHAQLERYVEILSHLADDCGWRAPQPRPLRLLDVGCGKGHLTFAAWHLLRHRLGLPAEVLGVEARAELVANASTLARSVAADGLHFVPGDIAQVPLADLDGLITLHACNTATDHALHRGITAGARLIVVAPCCHQEVRPALGLPAPLAPALRHGLLAERMAEWVTDALRTLVLEWAGYHTKVIEFVGSEHTARNLMLAAVRAPHPPDATARAAAWARIEALRSFFGVAHQTLVDLVAPPTGPVTSP